MKLESASRQVYFEKAVGAFGNAEPEFRFSGFSLFGHSFGEFTYHFTVQPRESPAIGRENAGRQRFAKPSYSVKGYRGFESLPLRSNNQINQFRCWAYVLWSDKLQKRYVGSTTREPLDRLHDHNHRKTSFTSSGIPLMHAERYPSLSEARKREIFLKSGVGRKWLDEHVPIPTSRNI